MKIRLTVTILVLLTGLAVWFYRQFLRPSSLPSKPRTIEQVLTALAPSVEHRLRPAFERTDLGWPPRNLTLLAFKAERRLELYASDAEEKPRFVRSYPILATSGSSGPKLREGDKQVPEGFYRIELLNPNSRYHLSLRVNYPNADDVERARQDGRDLSTLGGDIMIHGGAQSVGCLAVGNAAAEDLFVLAADSDWQRAVIVVSPVDFRRTDLPADYRPPADWVNRLYSWLRRELRALPLPPTHLTTRRL